MICRMRQYFTYALTFVYTSTTLLAVEPEELAYFYQLMVGQKEYKNGNTEEFVKLVDDLRVQLDIEKIAIDKNLSGILYRPKNIQPGEKRPCVIHSHGADFDNKIKTSTYHAEMSFLAAKKRVVIFAPNYNGPEKQATQDIINSIKFMQNQPYVDANRVMLRGGSNGSMRNARVLKYAHDLNLAGIHFFGGSYENVHDQYDDWPNIPIFIAHGCQDYSPRQAITFMQDLLCTNLNVQTFVSHSGDHHLIDQSLAPNDQTSPSAQELLQYVHLWLDFHNRILEGRSFQATDVVQQKIDIDAAFAFLNKRKFDKDQAYQQAQKFVFGRQHIHLNLLFPAYDRTTGNPSLTLSPSLAYLKLVLGNQYMGNREQDIHQFFIHHFYDQTIGQAVIRKEEPNFLNQIHTILEIEQDAWEVGKHSLYHTAISSAAGVYIFNSLWRQALADFNQPVSMKRLRGLDKEFTKYSDVKDFLSVMEKRQNGWDLFNYVKGFQKVAISVNCLGLFANHADTGSNTLYWWFKGNPNQTSVDAPKEITRFLKAVGIVDSWRIQRYITLMEKFAKTGRDEILFQIIIPHMLNDQWGYICESGGYPVRLNFDQNVMNTVQPSQVLSRFTADPIQFEKTLNQQEQKFRDPNCNLYSERIQERLIVHPIVMDDPRTVVNVYPRSPERYRRFVKSLSTLIKSDLLDLLLRQALPIQSNQFITPITIQQKFEESFNNSLLFSKEISDKLARLSESEIPNWFETLENDKNRRGALCALLKSGQFILLDALRVKVDHPSVDEDLIRTALTTKNLSALYWLKSHGILTKTQESEPLKKQFSQYLETFNNVVQKVIDEDIVAVPGSITSKTIGNIHRKLQDLGYKRDLTEFCRQVLNQCQDVQFYEPLLTSTNDKGDVIDEILKAIDQEQNPVNKRSLVMILVNHMNDFSLNYANPLAQRIMSLFTQSYLQADFDIYLKVLDNLKPLEHKRHLDQVLEVADLSAQQIAQLAEHYMKFFKTVRDEDRDVLLPIISPKTQETFYQVIKENYQIDDLSYNQCLLMYHLSDLDHYLIAAAKRTRGNKAGEVYLTLYNKTKDTFYLRRAIKAFSKLKRKRSLSRELFAITKNPLDLLLAANTKKHSNKSYDICMEAYYQSKQLGNPQKKCLDHALQVAEFLVHRSLNESMRQKIYDSYQLYFDEYGLDKATVQNYFANLSHLSTTYPNGLSPTSRNTLMMMKEFYKKHKTNEQNLEVIAEVAPQWLARRAYLRLFHQTKSLEYLRQAILVSRKAAEKRDLADQLFDLSRNIDDLLLGITDDRFDTRPDVDRYLKAYQKAKEQGKEAKFYYDQAFKAIESTQSITVEDAGYYSQLYEADLKEFGFDANRAHRLLMMRKLASHQKFDVDQFWLDLYRDYPGQSSLECILFYYLDPNRFSNPDDTVEKILTLNQEYPSADFAKWLVISCLGIENMIGYSEFMGRLFVPALEKSSYLMLDHHYQASIIDHLFYFSKFYDFNSQVISLLKECYQNTLNTQVLTFLLQWNDMTVSDFTKVIKGRGVLPVLTSLIKSGYFQNFLRQQNRGNYKKAEIIVKTVFNNYFDSTDPLHQEIKALLSDDPHQIAQFYRSILANDYVFYPSILLKKARDHRNLELFMLHHIITQNLQTLIQAWKIAKKEVIASSNLLTQYIFLTLDHKDLGEFKYRALYGNQDPANIQFNIILEMDHDLQYAPALCELQDLYQSNIFNRTFRNIAQDHTLTYEIYRESFRRTGESEYLYDLLSILVPHHPYQKIDEATKNMIGRVVDLLLQTQKDLSPLTKFMKGHPNGSWLSLKHREMIAQKENQKG